MSEFVKNILVPILTVVTTCLAGYLNFSINSVDQNLKLSMAELDSQMKNSEEARNERESQQEFNLKIYQMVTESLKAKDKQLQDVATAFVVVLVEDETLRSPLLRVLKQGGQPAIQERVSKILVEETKFQDEDQTRQVPSSEQARGFNWEDWDYDIFWCASSGDRALGQAARMKTQMEKEGSKGRIRVRELPESINAKKGYQINGYVIRHNRNELDQATALKHLGEKVLKSLDVTFDISPSRQQTPWYLSAFVCPQ